MFCPSCHFSIDFCPSRFLSFTRSFLFLFFSFHFLSRSIVLLSAFPLLFKPESHTISRQCQADRSLAAAFLSFSLSLCLGLAFPRRSLSFSRFRVSSLGFSLFARRRHGQGMKKVTHTSVSIDACVCACVISSGSAHARMVRASSRSRPFMLSSFSLFPSFSLVPCFPHAGVFERGRIRACKRAGA